MPVRTVGENMIGVFLASVNEERLQLNGETGESLRDIEITEWDVT